MCGVAGYINLNGESVSESQLNRMTDAISHRGPDGEGHWIEGPVAIGHRRLAIIDLSATAKQPMVSIEHRFVLSYNGELYNYKELRQRLEELGYWFCSNSDTEVVLNALIEWGKEALTMFNGMFALALWDRKHKELLLARDRYGIKPLYYSMQGHQFYFGSEQKAIKANSDYTHSLDKAALVEYFTFQNIFSDRTFDEDIKMLPAGSWATICLNSVKPSLAVTQYWDYCFEEPTESRSKSDLLEELDFLLQQAVSRQLVSDVEVGAYLSGGMDSGTLTALAAKQLPYIKTFTCGFDLSSASGLELTFDEREKAEAMSAKFKTEHYEMVLKSGDMERCLPKFSFHLEEPRVGQSYPNYYAAQLASKFVKVILSGAGGDELFAGYPWRYYKAATNSGFDRYVEQYYGYWQRLISDKQKERIFAPIWHDIKHIDTKEIFKNVFSKHPNELKNVEDCINFSLYFEAKTFLHGLFVVEDKLSMSHGLETRVPFMDNDLVDFAMRCPVRYKLNNLSDATIVNENDSRSKLQLGHQTSFEGKQILRNAMGKYIPEAIVNAKKQGFSSPDASWFKGESIEFVKRVVGNENANIYKVLNREAVQALVNEHFDGKENRRLLIWSLLNVEEWLIHENHAIS